METDTATVAAETVVAETIGSEILASAAQMTPMTGDVLLLLQHAMTEAASVATDTAHEEAMMIAEEVIVSVATDTAATDMAAIDMVETETGAMAATDTGATEIEIEATAATEIVGTVIATDMATEIVTVALDVTTGTEDTEVDTLVPLMTTTNGEEPSQKFRDAIQETKSDETRHESGQNCNYLKDLLMKNQQQNQ